MPVVHYRFKLEDKWHEVKGETGQTLLQMSEGATIRTPHACEEGGCGSCRGKLVEGKVEMLANDVLQDDELGAGLVLACQSVPKTDRVTIDFDATE